jgi:hypothetical protein
MRSVEPGMGRHVFKRLEHRSMEHRQGGCTLFLLASGGCSVPFQGLHPAHAQARGRAQSAERQCDECELRLFCEAPMSYGYQVRDWFRAGLGAGESRRSPSVKQWNCGSSRW